MNEGGDVNDKTPLFDGGDDDNDAGPGARPENPFGNIIGEHVK